MKKSRFTVITDYLAFVVRRKWLILMLFIAAAGAAALFALILPDVYVSESMILIEQRDVPDEFVKDLIAGNTEQRLNAIEKTILSRTNILKILNEFEDSFTQYRGLNDEFKVASLRKKINIEFPADRIRGSYLPVTNITIAYRDRDPDLAQRITRRLTELFIEQDSKARVEQVYGTTEFLSSELEKISDQLQKSESELQELKRKYRYELPEERSTNLRRLDQLQIEKNSNIEALDRSVAMKMQIEQQLSETPQTIPREQAMRTGGTPRNPELEAYLRKEQEYKETIARAKETHPEVRRLKAELEELKKDLPAEWIDGAPAEETEGTTEPSMAPNPAYQNLERQLQQTKIDIEIRERDRDRIESDIALYNRRVENTPKVEQEIATVVRTNTDLNNRYEKLKQDLADAELSASLENQEKGSGFTVLDPANYPLEPAPPQRFVIFLIGLILSLGVGVVVAFILDMFSPTVYTQWELERALEAQVLIEIPRISTPADLRKKSRLAAIHAASVVVGMGVYGSFLFFLYQKQNFLLKVLDPLVTQIRG